MGLCTGVGVVGNIGSEKRAKYGVVGTAVNLAARIESCTTGGQVLISSDGFIWENAPEPMPQLIAVAWGNDRFVGITDESILTSTDGRNWELQWTSSDFQLVDVAADGEALEFRVLSEEAQQSQPNDN